jgi:hypothetical protein
MHFIPFCGHNIQFHLGARVVTSWEPHRLVSMIKIDNLEMLQMCIIRSTHICPCEVIGHTIRGSGGGVRGQNNTPPPSAENFEKKGKNNAF